jgi:hypothetical protein
MFTTNAEFWHQRPKSLHIETINSTVSALGEKEHASSTLVVYLYAPGWIEINVNNIEKHSLTLQ